jgi:hypothetical protein
VVLPEPTAPEFLDLEAKWASLMSYGLTVEHLVHVGGNPLPVMTKDERRRTKSLLVVGLSSLVLLTSNQLQPSCTSRGAAA